MSVTTIIILSSYLLRSLQNCQFLKGFLTKSLYCVDTLSPTRVHTYPTPSWTHCPSNIWWSIHITMFPIIKYVKFLTRFITSWPTLFSRHMFYVRTKTIVVCLDLLVIGIREGLFSPLLWTTRNLRLSHRSTFCIQMEQETVWEKLKCCA